MKKDRRRSFAGRLRRLAIAVMLILLVPSLAVHLYGRLRLAAAISKLEAALGQELDLAKAWSPPPAEKALATFGGGADFLVAGWPGHTSEVWWAPVSRWSPEEKRRVRQVVERHRADLDSWHRVVPGPRPSFRTRYWDDTWADPSSLDLLRAAKLARFDAQLALDGGDLATALAAAGTIARISACFDDEPWLISALLSVATEKILLALVRELLESPRSGLDEAGLRQLETLLPTVDHRAKMLEALKSEALFAITVFGNGRPLADVAPPVEPIRLIFGRAAAAESVDASRRAIERIPMPYGGFAEEWFDIDQQASFHFLSWTLQTWLATDMSLEEAYRNCQRLRTDLEANLFDVVVKHQIAASQRQLVQAAILLRRTGLAAGGYPPERPRTALLEDPDPFTGKRILYRPGDDGSLLLELDGGIELARRFWDSSPELDPVKDNRVIAGAVHRIRMPPVT